MLGMAVVILIQMGVADEVVYHIILDLYKILEICAHICTSCSCGIQVRCGAIEWVRRFVCRLVPNCTLMY